MKDQYTKINVIHSLFWKFLEKGGTQGIQFIIQIILARLLLPKDYGIVALVTIFIVIANIFVQSGLNTALIQKKDTDEVDFSSVFYISLLIASLLYIALFFTAPLISKFYGEYQLTRILRVLSITLFFGAFKSIQNAVVAKKMQFKRLFISSFGAMVLSGIVGLFMAYAGFGVWALVVQQLVLQFLITLILWLTVKWRPKLLFSFVRVKGLFSYGWKLLISSLIDTLDRELRGLIIGKFYGPAILGSYNRGQQFPALIVNNIDGSIQSVMLPTLASHQEDRQRVKAIMRRSIMTSSFIVFPMMIGLAVVANPLIRVLLTEKWLPAVPFLQIYAMYFALLPIHSSNLQAINALGYSGIYLRLEIIKKIIGVIILIITFFYGVYALALGALISGIIASFINAYPNRKLLNYSYREQWRDIIPSLLLSLLMGMIIYNIRLIGVNPWIILFLQVTIGITVYLVSAKLLKLEIFGYLITTMKVILSKKGRKG